MNWLRIVASIAFDFLLLALAMAPVWISVFLPPPRAKRLAVAALLSLGLAGSAHAQVCRSNVCTIRTQPVVANVVQHQAYVAPVVAKQVVAQQAYAVYPYQYYVGQGIRDEAIAQKTADRVLELLQAKLEALQANGAPPTPPDSSLGRMQAIVDRTCVSCHSAETDPDRLDLTDVALLTAPQFEDVVRQVYTGKMPKNSQPLTDEEVALFVDAHLTRPPQ